MRIGQFADVETAFANSALTKCSNWIELGNKGANPILGRDTPIPYAGDAPTCTDCKGAIGALIFDDLFHPLSVVDLVAKAAAAGVGFSIPDVRVCEDCTKNNDVGGGLLTSGYYYGEDNAPKAGKCHHGIYILSITGNVCPLTWL